MQSLYLRLEALEFNSYHVQAHTQANTPVHTLNKEEQRRPNGHSNMAFVSPEGECDVNEREVAPREGSINFELATPAQNEISTVPGQQQQGQQQQQQEDPFAIVIVGKSDNFDSASSKNSLSAIPMRNFERPGSQLSVEPIEEVSKL